MTLPSQDKPTHRTDPVTTNNATLLIVGTGPGTGKSTVAAALHDRLEHNGVPVLCWYETEVLQQPEFAQFFQLFRNGDPAMVAALQVAVDSYLSNHVDAEQMFVAESLLPFVRWLLLGAVSDTAIDEYCHWLVQRLAPRSPTLLVLRCDRNAATERATADRGQHWFTQWAQRERDYPLFRQNPQLDPTDRTALFTKEQRFYDGLPWPLREFDTGQLTPADVAAAVLPGLSAPQPLPAMLPDGAYYSTSKKLPELRIENGRIHLMRVWLPLIPRADGSARISRSNTVVQTVNGVLQLDSARFGQITFTPSKKRKAREPGNLA